MGRRRSGGLDFGPPEVTAYWSGADWLEADVPSTGAVKGILCAVAGSKQSARYPRVLGALVAARTELISEATGAY
jgi:hypothetical protein